MTEGIKKLFESYKGVAFFISIIAVAVLVGLGRATSDQFLDFVKWGFGALVLARAGEEGLKSFGQPKEIKSEKSVVVEKYPDGSTSTTTAHEKSKS